MFIKGNALFLSLFIPFALIAMEQNEKPATLKELCIQKVADLSKNRKYRDVIEKTLPDDAKAPVKKKLFQRVSPDIAEYLLEQQILCPGITRDKNNEFWQNYTQQKKAESHDKLFKAKVRNDNVSLNGSLLCMPAGPPLCHATDVKITNNPTLIWTWSDRGTLTCWDEFGYELYRSFNSGRPSRIAFNENGTSFLRTVKNPKNSLRKNVK